MATVYCLDLLPDLQCVSAEAWGSFVQAAVSILAIAVGAVAIYWQVGREQRNETKRQLAEEVRRLSAIASAVFHCRALAEQMRDQSAKGIPIDWEMSGLRAHAELLNAIPALDVPDSTATFAISQVCLAAAALEQGLTEPGGLDPPPMVRHGRREPHLNLAIMRFETSERVVRSTLQDRGADVPPLTLVLDDVPYCSLSVTVRREPGLANESAVQRLNRRAALGK
jgi:hypothetical protein